MKISLSKYHMICYRLWTIIFVGYKNEFRRLVVAKPGKRKILASLQIYFQPWNWSRSRNHFVYHKCFVNRIDFKSLPQRTCRWTVNLIYHWRKTWADEKRRKGWKSDTRKEKRKKEESGVNKKQRSRLLFFLRLVASSGLYW